MKAGSRNSRWSFSRRRRNSNLQLGMRWDGFGSKNPPTTSRTPRQLSAQQSTHARCDCPSLHAYGICYGRGRGSLQACAVQILQTLKLAHPQAIFYRPYITAQTSNPMRPKSENAGAAQLTLSCFLGARSKTSDASPNLGSLLRREKSLLIH